MINRIPLASLYPNEKFLTSRALNKIYDDFKSNDSPTADFSDILFVLPSREAGRLFRAKAAQKFKIYGGVTSLKIILPEELAVNQADIRTPQALMLETFFDILKKAAADKKFSDVLPDVEYTDNTLLSYAEYLLKVRENIILESTLDTADFIETLEKNSPLRLKLEAYLTLEKEFYCQLNNPYNKAQIILDTMNNPFERFKDVKKIILIECTEIRNAIALLLDKTSSKIPVEHYLNVTEEELLNFDAYGRPVTEKMLESHLEWDIEKIIRSYSNPVQEAMKISSFLEKDTLPDCIGVLNAGLNSALTHILETKNIEVSNPAPQPLNSFYWTKLFLKLLDLRNKNVSFDDVYFFASDESVLNYFKMNFNSIGIRQELDKLQRDHLIQDLDSLDFFIKQSPENYKTCSNFCSELNKLRQEIQSLDNDNIIENVYNVFQTIARNNSLENMDFNTAEVSLESLKNTITSVRNVNDSAERMMIFRHLCNSTEVSGAEQFKDNAVTLSGFLDLVWYENPSLIIGGISEESFAASAEEDMFFPEKIRCQLNWSSAYSRFGADLHRFRQLVTQYGEGELFITYSVADTDGMLNTLPRLFFNVDDEKLLKHCKMLFGQELSEKITPVSDKKIQQHRYTPAFTDDMPQKISVTALKTYINCPYTFYLERIRNCSKLEDEAIELQANQIGNILHCVFESYGKKYSDNLPEAEELQKFLHEETNKFFTAQVGYAVNNITVMQNEVMHKTIDAFMSAEQTIRSSFASHKIHAVEHKINIPYGELYDRIQQKMDNILPAIPEKLRNIHIVGKIDRIDLAQDSEGKNYCFILDYKTSGTSKKPSESHFAAKAAEHLDEEKMLAAGTDKYFADMQLIIYNLLAECFRSELNIPQDAEIQCGYFNLPSDVSKTKTEFCTELDCNVLQCGAAVLHYLMQKIFIEKYFWPPSLSYQYGIIKNYFPDINTDDLNSEVQNG